MSKVLLSSGGMDSFLLAHEPELRGADHVFVNIGQKYVGKEYTSASRIARELNTKMRVVVGTNLGKYEHETGIIPFRNMQLILCAAIHGTEIYFGVIADEINSDKSVEFCAAAEEVLNISHRAQYWTEGKQFQVLTPFRQFTKTELLERYLDNNGSWEAVLRTVSCYDGGDKHCGHCPSCFKRWVALTNVSGRNGWYDWNYANDPFRWKSIQEWDTKIREYGDKRASELSSALTLASA